MSVSKSLPASIVSQPLSNEITLIAERVGAVLEQCQSEKEIAAVEDALQSLAAARTSLNNINVLPLFKEA